MIIVMTSVNIFKNVVMLKKMLSLICVHHKVDKPNEWLEIHGGYAPGLLHKPDDGIRSDPADGVA